MHRFKLLERIGNGGYSQVFRTLDQQTGKHCALKVMKQPYERFRAAQDMELIALRKFQGRTGVIQLIDSFLEDGFLILVFELMEETLIDYYRRVQLEECRSLSESEIKKILLQVTLALEALHSEGYAHRDIKPENILVERQGAQIIAKLVDFGLTKKLQDGRQTNYIATRWYRAPEQLLSMAYQTSVDMFAIGCLMAELYSGREVFCGINNLDQLHKICGWLGVPTADNWPQGASRIKSMGVALPMATGNSLRRLAPGISDDGFSLLSKLLTLNPSKRITAKQMLRHPYFSSVMQELPVPIQKQVISIGCAPTKDAEERQSGSARKKQQSQPKLTFEIRAPYESVDEFCLAKRPVSIHHPISIVGRNHHQTPQADTVQRLAIAPRSRTPSYRQPAATTNKESIFGKLIPREAIRIENNFIPQRDSSFIRSKLGMAQPAVKYQPPPTVTSIATHTKERPRSNITVEQPAAKILKRDLSPNEQVRKNFHSIDRPAKQAVMLAERPSLENCSRHMLSTDRLSVKKQPSMQRNLKNESASQSQHLLCANNNGERSLKEAISSKTRSKVNNILLSYRNAK